MPPFRERAEGLAQHSKQWILQVSTSISPPLYSSAVCDNALFTAGTLPLELLVKVLSLLPGIGATAACACVSRLWARAAALAVPKRVDVKTWQEASWLLEKPHLGAVEAAQLLNADDFLQGVLTGRICAEAEALEECCFWG